MIILGVDPGTLITGYGVIQVNGPQLCALDYGCIRPPKSLLLPKRYQILFEGLELLIARHHPDAVVVELQFVLKNVQSAIKLGMARAMALLAASRAGIPTFEYAPTKAKRSVVGTGSASKWQVQRMIQTILRLPAPPEPDDAADALALALCHAGSLCMNPFAASSKRRVRTQRSSNVEASPTDSPSL